MRKIMIVVWVIALIALAGCGGSKPPTKAELEANYLEWAQTWGAAYPDDQLLDYGYGLCQAVAEGGLQSGTWYLQSNGVYEVHAAQQAAIDIQSRLCPDVPLIKQQG